MTLRHTDQIRLREALAADDFAALRALGWNPEELLPESLRQRAHDLRVAAHRAEGTERSRLLAEANRHADQLATITRSTP